MVLFRTVMRGGDGGRYGGKKREKRRGSRRCTTTRTQISLLPTAPQRRHILRTTTATKQRRGRVPLLGHKESRWNTLQAPPVDPLSYHARTFSQVFFVLRDGCLKYAVLFTVSKTMDGLTKATQKDQKADTTTPTRKGGEAGPPVFCVFFIGNGRGSTLHDYINECEIEIEIHTIHCLKEKRGGEKGGAQNAPREKCGTPPKNTAPRTFVLLLFLFKEWLPCSHVIGVSPAFFTVQ